MVGNKEKRSKSKPKALKHGPAEPEPEPFQICLDDSADASEGEDGKNDISNGTEISLEEEKMIYGSVVSDGLEENNQNVLEENALEKDAATEIKVDKTEAVCTLEGTIDNVKEMSDGGHPTTNLGGEENEERINSDNPEEDEAPLKFDRNDFSTGDENEVTTEDVSANNEASASDHGLRKDMTDNLENPEEPSKVDADEPVGTPSNRAEEENENITNEDKVVSGEVNRPKRKVIKKKLVKKKLVGRNAVPPSDENHASGEACEVDADEHIDDKEKASDVNKASDEACKADNNEHVSNEEEAEVKPSVTVKKRRIRIRKRKAPQGDSGIATINDTQKPQAQNDKSGSEKQIAINEPDVKKDEVEKSEDKASPLKRSKNKKIANKEPKEVVPKDVKNPKEGKSSKKVDSMGMIFMCSSETKKDCFRYKVLGLPASKRDIVLKIYKGMRLFLFDVDLRMMYGIYKATGRGGYNIEPRAFKSKFPSQVRFAVLEDSVPLAEEIFKKVLEDNYYSKKKFNFQLNGEQVKNLCKLFHETSRKASSTKAASKTQRAAATSSTSQRDDRRDNKRKRVEDSRRVAVARPPPVEPERIRRRPHEEIRHAPVVIAHRYHQRPTYEGETYVPSMAVAPVPIYQPLPPPRSPPRSTTYSYDRVLGVDRYRRETIIDSRDLAPSRESRLPIERSHYDSRDLAPSRESRLFLEGSHYDSRDLAPSRESRLPLEGSHYDSRDLAPSRESRLPIERSYYDSYLSYRERPQVYSGQAYISAPRREHYDYNTSIDVQYGAEYYRTADYRPPLPLYSRY